MNNLLKNIFITLTLVIVLFVLLYSGAKWIIPDVDNEGIQNTNLSDQRMVGLGAPYFDLPNVGGGRLKISDFANTTLIILFWTTWNTASADQLKILDDYMVRRSKEMPDIKILTINSQEDVSIVSSYIERGAYEVATLLDESGAITQLFGVKGLPTTFFIDKLGVVREVWTGVLSNEEIMHKVEKIIK